MSLDVQVLGPLFELSPDAVLGIKDGIIAFANPAAKKLLCLSAGEPAASHIPSSILSLDVPQCVTTWYQGGESRPVSVVRQEDVMLLTIPSVPPTSFNTPVPGHNQMIHEMGEYLFAAMLALDKIIKSSQLDEDPELRRYTEILYQNFYRLRRLHQHMTLVITPVEDVPAAVAIDMERLCKDLCSTVNDLIKDTGASITIESTEGICLMLADPSLMEIMILNVLSNSIAHTQAGDRISVKLSRQAGRIVLAISDTGTGIPPEVLPVLFTWKDLPNAMDPSGGGGLGLRVVKRIVDSYKGTLMLESQLGIGTLMHLSFPEAGPDDPSPLPPSVPYGTHYGASGMTNILTELSNVLDRSLYNKVYFD